MIQKNISHTMRLHWLKNSKASVGAVLWRKLFLAFRPATLLKRGSNTSFFRWNLHNFQEHLFWRTSVHGCIWRFNLIWNTFESSSDCCRSLSFFSVLAGVAESFLVIHVQKYFRKNFTQNSEVYLRPGG